MRVTWLTLHPRTSSGEGRELGRRARREGGGKGRCEAKTGREGMMGRGEEEEERREKEAKVGK